MFGEDWLLSRVMFLIPLMLSLSVHEWAHAWTAWRMGDPTAAREGRLTLNPLAHIDPIGTLALPLLGVPFGWAKPVPINPGYFRGNVSLGTGLVLTAVAGPLSNILLAAGGLLILALMAAFGQAWAMWRSPLEIFVILNVILAVFNMLPIPPLDGSRVVDGLLPDRLRPAWDAFCQLGPFALLIVIVLPILFGVSILAWPVAYTQSLIDWVLQTAR